MTATAVARRGFRRRPPPRPGALVLGDIDLVRPLALAGICSAVVAVPGDPTRFSRYATTIAHWDNDSRNDELVEPLLAWAYAQPERPVLYYQWDGHLLFVSRHRRRLAEGFRFVLDEAERIEAMLDKERFLALAERLDLPVPPARAVHPLRSVPHDHADLGFPLVVKPTDRTDDCWKHLEQLGKAKRVEDQRELEAAWPALAEYGRPVLLQRLIPGPESRIESYHVFVTPDGAVAAEFTGRKVRTIPEQYGATTACEITDEADVKAVGREVITRLGLRGVAKLDFKRAPDGALFLLEVNPRFNLWHYPGAVAGVNLPALVRDHLEGRRMPDPSSLRPRAGVTWCSPYDLATARGRPGELVNRLRFAASSEAKAIWATDDPLPLVATAALRLAAPARDLVRRALPVAAGAGSREGRRVRYGLVSDVHANLDALRVALRALEELGADQVVCAGDVVGYGPQPNECIGALASSGAVCVAGNHDLMALGVLDASRHGELVRSSNAFTAAMLGSAEREWLSLLRRVAIAPGLVVAHGSLEDPERYVETDAASDAQLDALARHFPGARLLVLGHTHRARLYGPRRASIRPAAAGGQLLLPSGRALVNPGSVGQSRQAELAPRARCALVELAPGAAPGSCAESVRFLSLDYDVAATRRLLGASGLSRSSVHLVPGRAGALARRVSRSIEAHLRSG